MKYKKVNELMTSPAITSESNTSIKDVIKLMREHNIGFIPVTKNNIIVGVITDRDILIRAIGIYKLNTKIEKIMTNGDIFCVNSDTSILECAKIMAKKKIRRLVVLKDGHVCGVITTKNMLGDQSLLPYIEETYINNETIREYNIYMNSNPHDSIKTSDYPL